MSEITKLPGKLTNYLNSMQKEYDKLLEDESNYEDFDTVKQVFKLVALEQLELLKAILKNGTHPGLSLLYGVDDGILFNLDSRETTSLSKFGYEIYSLVKKIYDDNVGLGLKAYKKDKAVIADFMNRAISFYDLDGNRLFICEKENNKK